MAYTTATLTGTYHTTDGQPAVGTVEIAPNSRILIDTDGDVVLSGAITVTLDETGSFAIVLPSTDDATVEPATGRQYRVEVNLQHRHFPPVRVELAAGETVDMADVTSVAETAAAVAVWLTQEEYDAVVDRVAALEESPGGVTTVNGESGAVTLSAADVGADPAGAAAAAEAAALAADETKLSVADLDAETAERVQNGPLTVAALSASYAARNPAAILANFDPGQTEWTAHRCGGSLGVGNSVGPYPQNTLEGARGIVDAAKAVSIPNFLLNVQVRELADGSLAVIHSTTTDSTRNISARVSSLTGPALKATKVDTARWWGAPGFGDLPSPMFDDFLREFGGKVAMQIGAYNSTEFPSTNGQRVVDAVQAYGLDDTVLIGNFVASQLYPARDADIATILFLADASIPAATLAGQSNWAPGKPKRVGLDSTAADSYISSLVAAGLHVSVYGTTRRSDRDRLLALGGHGLISDDLIYQATDSPLAANDVDPHMFGVWSHGDLEGPYGRGVVLAVGGGRKLDYVAASGFAQWCIEGSRCPVLDNADDTYRIETDFVIDAVDTDTTRWFGLKVCLDTDAYTTGNSPTLHDGYTVLLRFNGGGGMWETDRAAQTDTQRANFVSPVMPALVQGDTGTLKVEVAATQVIVSVIRGGTTYTYTVTNSAKRGNYFAIGKAVGSGATKGAVTFKNTKIVNV